MPAGNLKSWDTSIQTSSTLSSTSTSISSSSDVKPVNLHSPIPEAEENETPSETANAPITPTKKFRDTSNEALHNNPCNDGSQPSFQYLNKKVSLLVNTAATPPSVSTLETDAVKPAVRSIPLQTPSHSEPIFAITGLKRSLSGLFRRSNHMATSTMKESSTLTHGVGGSDTALAETCQRLSTRDFSTRTSLTTSRSNTPSSPRSPFTDGVNDGNLLQPPRTAGREPQSTQFFSRNNKSRSSTGISLKGMRWGADTYAGPDREKKLNALRHRASSVDPNCSPRPSNRSRPEAELVQHNFAIGPAEGTGLKARRMSVNLPDNFTVDVVDLYREFADQSRMLGRRGRSLGKGATADVNLMTRKGFGTELYAVKCFRPLGRGENAEEYEKKVKSEYSIAKSLHHPNVVETIRLCTNKGRWNHVMEYCDQGDLFSLVQKGYLKQKDRASDRECLFKQLIQGIQYLHCHGIAHRDIKLENLLITSESKLKITDFGVSEVFSGIHPGLRAAGGECGKEMGQVRLCAPAICGSLPYIAPEVVDKIHDYDPRPLDVWSSAIVMIHLVFGGALWNSAKSDQQGYDSLLKGWTKWEARHPEDSSISEVDYPFVTAFDRVIQPAALKRLLLTMLHPDPAKRSTIEDVASNRWLKRVECCQVNSYDDPTTMLDASKKRNCFTGVHTKVVKHNHLPPITHKGHHLIRLPGSTDMD